MLDLVNSEPFLYTFEDFTVSAAAASTTIAFAGAGGGGWFLDDVSVSAVTPAMPEPTSLALLATAVLGFGVLRSCRSSTEAEAQA